MTMDDHDMQMLAAYKELVDKQSSTIEKLPEQVERGFNQSMRVALMQRDAAYAECKRLRDRIHELERWHSFHQTQPFITDEDVAAIVEAYETGDAQ